MTKKPIPSASAWYLIYTKPRQEQLADDHLQRQGYRTYLPLLSVQRRQKQTYRFVTEPLFPRYLFIQLNTETDNWAPIRSTRGVTSLVRFGGVPAAVPSNFMQYLQETAQKRLETSPLFQVGDRVRIVEGALLGYEGIFEMQSSAKRVVVLLDVVNKAMRVDVWVDQVVSLG